MTTIRLQHPRYCEDSTAVDLDTGTIVFSIDEDGRRETHTIRLFWPRKVNGIAFDQYARHWPFNMAERATPDDDFDYLRLGALVGIDMAYSKIDPRNARRFNLDTLDKVESLRSLRKDPRLRTRPKEECVEALSPGADEPTADLLHQAIHPEPVLRIPIPPEEYADFREAVLSGLLDALALYTDVANRALAERKRRSSGRKRGRQTARAHNDANADAEFVSNMVSGMMNLLIEETILRETDEAAPFKDVVESSHNLLRPILEGFAREGLEIPLSSDTEFSSFHVSSVREHLDRAAADAILTEALHLHAQVFADELGLSRKARDTSAPQLPWGIRAPLVRKVRDRSRDIRRQADALRRAIASRRPIEKFQMLLWIVTNMCDRTVCVRLLRREAEMAMHAVAGAIARDIYAELRHQLTPVERRAFALMHFPLPAFNFRVASLSPVIWSFYTGMGPENAATVLLSLVYRQGMNPAIDPLIETRERRWRAYLNFYSYWIEAVREADRATKRTTRTRSNHRAIDGGGSNPDAPVEIRLGRALEDPRGKPRSILDAIVRDDGRKLEEWCAKYCTELQSFCIAKRFREGLTEEAIAAERDVTQQAVSKAIRAGLKRLRVGLEQDLQINL